MRRTVVLLVSILSLLSSGSLSQTVSNVYITGNFTVGSVLTGHSATTGVTASETISQHWYRISPRESLAAGTVSYTIQPAELGGNIYYKVLVLQNSTGDTLSADSSAVSPAISENSKPVVSGINILGELRSGKTLYGTYTYYDLENDAEGASSYKWHVADNALGGNAKVFTGVNSIAFTLPDSCIGKYIKFLVTPVAQTGTSPGDEKATSSWLGPVKNDPPVATIGVIMGPSKLNVNDVITGNFEYTDAEGDAEDGSLYEWWRSPSSNISGATKIPSDSGIAYKIALIDTGKYIFFRVTPKAKTGNIQGNRVASTGVGPVNTPPYVSSSSVAILGTAAVDSTLTGKYIFHDGDGDHEGTSIFRWLRNGTAPIPGATGNTCLLTSADEGYEITFEVTPVSATRYPDSGAPVKSLPTPAVDDHSVSKPVASQVCIEGKMATGEILTGRYHYTFTTGEGISTYKWYRNNNPIPLAETTTYTLTDLDYDQDIAFEVTPVSSNHTPKKGAQVRSNPLARITLPRETYSVADSDIVLTANPLGGIFYGEGVINGKFSPSSVDYNESPFWINYQLNIKNTKTTCQQNASKRIFVTGILTDFESFRDMYCQNSGRDTVYVKKIPAGATSLAFYLTDPNGIVEKINDSTIVIDPGRMRAGNKDDTLYFRAIAGTAPIKIFRPFVIDSIARVTIKNLDSAAVVCNNIVPYELFVSHPGGVFEGPVVNGKLDPSGALGDTLVKYTYTTKRGCVSSVTIPVKINPAPVVLFAAADSCIESSSDTTRFINNTNSKDLVNIWLWEFSDAGGSSTNNSKAPGYLYKTGGFHKVTLTATTINNCLAKKEETIDLGIKPLADFYWENECYHPSDSLWLFDNTFSTSLIASRSWNFFDGDSLHTVKNLKYPKKTTGYLHVEYIVRTNYKNCHDTVSKSIYIRPSVSLANDDYFENFESNKGGWEKDYEILNTWSFGKPDRTKINRAFSGNNAWYTGYNIDNQKVESSAIISPCFDFTTIKRPMISLKLWKRFDQNRDGAALQYKIGDLPGWQYVGTLDDGINWYNSTLIKGRPGGDQIGWTSKNQQDNAWGEARHKLDELTGEKDVKFRIAYGSDGTSQDNDGLAFDDIWIGRRTRGVLLEHFTNFSSSSPGSVRAMIVSDLANRGAEDIINIQYHTNFPGADPYYNDNPGDASARFLFYGLSRVPYSIIDGGTGLVRNDYANIFDYLIADIDSNDLIRRSLITPSFSVTLNSSVSGGILSITGQIKALEAINSGNVTLYLAVTEKKSISPIPGATGETEFFNVFRKFIPDAGGISLKKTWNKDETQALSEKTWAIEKIPDAADIEVIAFIQNNITKEIYQAESNLIQGKIVGIDNLFTGNGKGFSLYPNPAGSRLTVVFEKAIEADADIRIYDFSGTVILTYKTGAGETEFTIDDLSLKSGIYLVRISSGNLYLGYKKLIVSQN